jgi:hypothetical protein
VGGDNALYLWDVAVLNAPVGGYLFSASNVQEGLRASLRVVVYIDMGGHNGCNEECLVLACGGVWSVCGGNNDAV